MQEQIVSARPDANILFGQGMIVAKPRAKPPQLVLDAAPTPHELWAKRREMHRERTFPRDDLLVCSVPYEATPHVMDLIWSSRSAGAEPEYFYRDRVQPLPDEMGHEIGRIMGWRIVARIEA